MLEISAAGFEFTARFEEEAAPETVAAIGRAYAEAVNMRGRPTAILARTMKGRGVAAVQDAVARIGGPVGRVDPGQVGPA